MSRTLSQKLERGQRLNATDALELLVGPVPLGELMYYAHQARMRRHPGGRVTFVYDTNPNYTNVCETKCEFCAFWRNARSKESYTLTPDALAARVSAAAAAGATTVLLQGGHNPKIKLADWLAYIEAIRAACPDIHIHPYSPPRSPISPRSRDSARNTSSNGSPRPASAPCPAAVPRCCPSACASCSRRPSARPRSGSRSANRRMRSASAPPLR